MGRTTGLLWASKILHRIARQHGPVTVFEIGHLVGEGRQRNGVRTENILAITMADGQRAAHAGTDQQIRLVS